MNVVSQFMYVPTDTHLVTVERILCYLDDPGRGLLYTKNEELSIEAYTDATGSVDDRRSISGYYI